MGLEQQEKTEKNPIDTSWDKKKLLQASEKTANIVLWEIRGRINKNANPYNRWVEDYSDKWDFNKAYSFAKKTGEKEFIWNGERYSTTIKNIPGMRIKQRDDFKGNMISNYANLFAGDTGIFPTRDINGGERRSTYKERYDLYDYYFGMNPEHGILTKSKYYPPNAKTNFDNYIAIKDDLFINQVIDIWNNLTENDKQKAFNGSIHVSGYAEDHPDFQGDFRTMNELEAAWDTAWWKREATNAIGQFRIGSGKDDRGEYISYYDLFDASTGNAKNLYWAKSFEIYDRIYVKDYGDNEKKRMYYSDKELSELDLNKKNFDTLALQRELSNRWYDFPKSKKQNWDFDGILWDETKKALLDWQKKH